MAAGTHLDGNIRFQEVQRLGERHLRLLSSGTNHMRTNGVLTDVTLICGGQEFHAHRVVLAASSPFFKTMFTNGMKETSADSVHLPTVDPNIMDKVLSFIYTGNTDVDLRQWDEVTSLLETAHLFQVNIIVQYCCTVLLETLTASQFLEHWNLAVKYSENMKEQIISYLAQNFAEVSASEDFKQGSAELLDSILTSDAISNQNTDCVLKAILIWVSCDIDERRSQIDTLLSKINLKTVSNNSLITLANETYLKNTSIDLLDYVLKSLAFKCLQNQDFKKEENYFTVSDSFSEAPFEENQFIVFKDLDYAEGGKLQCYNPDTGKKTAILSFQFDLLLNSALCYNERLVYFLGGRTKSSKACDSCCVFNTFTPEWSAISSLQQARYAAGAAVWNGLIYVVGGIDINNKDLNTAECYNVAEAHWSRVAPMTAKRRHPSLMSTDSRIFVLSSTSDYRERPLEFYEPATNQWTTVNLDKTFTDKLQHDTCFFSWSDNSLNIMTFSKSNHVVLYRKQNQFTEYKLPNSSQALLCFASISHSTRETLFIVDANGTFMKYIPEEDKWLKMQYSMDNPTYVIFLKDKGKVHDLKPIHFFSESSINFPVSRE